MKLFSSGEPFRREIYEFIEHQDFRKFLRRSRIIYDGVNTIYAGGYWYKPETLFTIVIFIFLFYAPFEDASNSKFPAARPRTRTQPKRRSPVRQISGEVIFLNFLFFDSRGGVLNNKGEKKRRENGKMYDRNGYFVFDFIYFIVIRLINIGTDRRRFHAIF